MQVLCNDIPDFFWSTTAHSSGISTIAYHGRLLKQWRSQVIGIGRAPLTIALALARASREIAWHERDEHVAWISLCTDLLMRKKITGLPQI